MSNLYLLPANGISNIAYQHCLKLINHSCESIVYPPLLTPPPPIPNSLDWSYFYDFISPKITGSNLVGLGHSLGGTLLLYHALKHPEIWKSIVVVEPALFGPVVNFLYPIVRFMKLEYMTHPMIRITKYRRESFDSLDNVYTRWRQNPSFQFFSDEALKLFIQASIVQSSGSYTLRFPKAWEIEIYRTMCTLDSFIWRNIHTLKPKLIIVAGQTSNTFLSGCRKKIQPFADEFITIPHTSHLLPFETPTALATIINKQFELI